MSIDSVLYGWITMYQKNQIEISYTVHIHASHQLQFRLYTYSWDLQVWSALQWHERNETSWFPAESTEMRISFLVITYTVSHSACNPQNIDILDILNIHKQYNSISGRLTDLFLWVVFFAMHEMTSFIKKQTAFWRMGIGENFEGTPGPLLTGLSTYKLYRP